MPTVGPHTRHLEGCRPSRRRHSSTEVSVLQTANTTTCFGAAWHFTVYDVTRAISNWWMTSPVSVSRDVSADKPRRRWVWVMTGLRPRARAPGALIDRRATSQQSATTCWQNMSIMIQGCCCCFDEEFGSVDKGAGSVRKHSVFFYSLVLHCSIAEATSTTLLILYVSTGVHLGSSGDHVKYSSSDHQ